MSDCWNTIGVRGDRSCPDLQRHVHCRNCPVYAGAAQALLDREASSADIADATRHFAKAKQVGDGRMDSVVVFRVGSEWFALPTEMLTEIADVRPIHSLPHRRGGTVLGVANVRGELLVCVSLARLLDVEESAMPAGRDRTVMSRRLLVLRRDRVRAVCPVDEVDGICHINPGDLRDVPTTVAKATGTHARAVLSWNDRSVGLIDGDALCQTLQRSLS